jgi:hypothetical protein
MENLSRVLAIQRGKKMDGEVQNVMKNLFSIYDTKGEAIKGE